MIAEQTIQNILNVDTSQENNNPQKMRPATIFERPAPNNPRPAQL